MPRCLCPGWQGGGAAPASPGHLKSASGTLGGSQVPQAAEIELTVETQQWPPQRARGMEAGGPATDWGQDIPLPQNLACRGPSSPPCDVPSTALTPALGLRTHHPTPKHGWRGQNVPPQTCLGHIDYFEKLQTQEWLCPAARLGEK